jgi:hypothetical protein
MTTRQDSFHWTKILAFIMRHGSAGQYINWFRSKGIWFIHIQIISCVLLAHRHWWGLDSSKFPCSWFMIRIQLPIKPGYLTPPSDWSTGCTTVKSGIDSRQGPDNSVTFTSCWTVLGPNHFPSNCYQWHFVKVGSVGSSLNTHLLLETKSTNAWSPYLHCHISSWRGD